MGTKGNINWGILGTASIARDYVIPSIQKSKNGKVLAIAGRNEERVRKFSDKFHIPISYNSYHLLVESPDIDAVYIPLPNSLHHQWTIKSAEKGKHVLCEKPLALNSQQCREMISACNSHDVLLMEAFMYRFHPQIEALLFEIESGTVGKVNEVRSSFWFKVDNLLNIRYQKDLGGGALMDLGCYCVDMSRLILGSEPESVRALSRIHNERKVDEITLGMLSFNSLQFAYFDCGFLGPLYNAVQVIGTNGIIELPEAFEFPQNPRIFIFENNATSPTRTINLEAIDPYRLMVEHFADCILNESSPKFPASCAEKNMRIIERLTESVG